MSAISVSQKRRGRPPTGEMPRIGLRLPADVIDALKAYAVTRNLGVSEALRDLIQASVNELSEFEVVVVGLDRAEAAALDRIRGERSRPDMIRILLAHHLRP